MTDADSKRYDIYFAGECLDGHTAADVRAAIGKLFKAEGDTLEQLFSGQRQRIKRDCDRATAVRYQKAMANVGARAIVTNAAAPAAPSAEQAAATAPSQAADAESPPQEAAEDTADMSLAPAGSDVLRPEERASIEPASIDVAHISVADAGEDLSIEPIEAVPPVEAPDLEVEDLGVDLDQTPLPEPAAAPDTSAIDLAPADYDLSDCAPPTAPAPDVDLDTLSLADTGSDLLSESERQKPQANAPDTSHLALDPSDDP